MVRGSIHFNAAEILIHDTADFLNMARPRVVASCPVGIRDPALLDAGNISQVVTTDVSNALGSITSL